jgi:hypothetical protein
MTDLFADRPPEPTRRRRFQFSLRTLFLVSFLFAIFCAGIFSNFDGVRYLTLVFFLMTYPMVLLSFAIYARGYLRAFGIGAAITFIPFSLPGIFFLYLAYMGIAMGFSGATPDPTVDLSNTSSLSDGVQYLWPSLSVFGIVFLSGIPGMTVVVTRWVIDHSRRKEALAAMPAVPLVVPVVVPTPHIETAKMEPFSPGTYAGSSAEDAAMR